jgi:hypothetical protein
MWIKVNPGSDRSNFSTLYHLNGNEVPSDYVNLGDRVLCAFPMYNEIYYVNYDINTGNTNLYRTLAFFGKEGVWGYLHHSYSSLL